MPPAPEHLLRSDEPSSQALGRQTDAAQAHQDCGQHVHSLAQVHGAGLNGLQVEVSPVLAGIWARVFTTLAILGLLWMAIFWAFVGNG